MAFVLGCQATALILTFLLRLLMFSACHDMIGDESAGSITTQATAFVKGIWFDTVIGCYISILPLTLMCICGIIGYYRKWIMRFVVIYTSVLYTLVFLISSANIPYFKYFFKNINSSIFEWFEYKEQTAMMVTEEASYLVYLIPFIVATIAYITVAQHIGCSMLKANHAERGGMSIRERIMAVGVSCVLIGACIFGIRGRVGYNPIKISAAYYCNDAFLNQLGVSPTFNLLTSVMDDNRKDNMDLNLMDDKQAVENIKTLLGRNEPKEPGLSPIRKHIDGKDTEFKGRNVVLIFMESMSADLMGHFGNKDNITPFLDSLMIKSMAFHNFFSAGIHTNHGMFATLYSFPAIMKKNMMKNTVIPNISGLPTVLKDNGYATMFFMTHESQYDNMNAFFRTNGFDEIYSQEDYPADKVVNGFGVQDDFLFDYAIPVLNKHASEGNKPFFACLLSISNHPPYMVPEYFHPKNNDVEKQIVEYADWSIKKFFSQACRQPWFDNTIFILVGDHGKLVGKADCEMPQSYNHVPFMIYGKGIEPKELFNFGGQVDIAPTVLGLLGMEYDQIGLGVNLLGEKRPCMYFTADNMVGARNESHFYFYEPATETEYFYDCNDFKMSVSKDKSHPDFKMLKNYSFSMIQGAQWLINEGYTTSKRALGETTK